MIRRRWQNIYCDVGLCKVIYKYKQIDQCCYFKKMHAIWVMYYPKSQKNHFCTLHFYTKISELPQVIFLGKSAFQIFLYSYVAGHLKKSEQ